MLVGGQPTDDEYPSILRALLYHFSGQPRVNLGWGLGLLEIAYVDPSWPQRQVLVAHTSTLTKVGVAVAVTLPVPLLTPVLEGEGGLEGDLLRPPDADPVREPLGVVEMVGESVCVPMALGVLELDTLPLPLLPPLAGGGGGEEGGGGGDRRGGAGVGKTEREAVGQAEVDADTVPLTVPPTPRVGDSVAVMVWVTEVGRENMQHTLPVPESTQLLSPPAPSQHAPTGYAGPVTGFDADVHTLPVFAR